MYSIDGIFSIPNEMTNDKMINWRTWRLYFFLLNKLRYWLYFFSLAFSQIFPSLSHTHTQTHLHLHQIYSFHCAEFLPWIKCCETFTLNLCDWIRYPLVYRYSCSCIFCIDCTLFYYKYMIIIILMCSCNCNFYKCD